MYQKSDIIKSESKKINIFLILFLIPIFSANSGMANEVYFILAPLILLWVYLFRPYIPNFSKDYAFIFLVMIALFSLYVDFNAGLVTSLESLKKTDTWPMMLSVLICFQVAIMRINFVSFIITMFIGLMVFYASHFLLISTGSMELSALLNNTGASFIYAAGSLMLLMSGKRLLSLLLLLLTIGLYTRGIALAGIIAFLLYLYITYIGGRIASTSWLTPKRIVIIVIASVFFVEIFLGLTYYLDKGSVIHDLTTGRSFYYSIILIDWLNTGLNVFLPVSSVFSSDILTEITLWAENDQGDLLYGVAQCPHSLTIELVVDYGIFAFTIFIIGFIVSAHRLSIIAVLFFLLQASFSCENFAPMYYVTFYIMYRILLSEEWRFILPQNKVKSINLIH